MPSVNSSFPSKWLKPEDFTSKEMVFTIKDVTQDMQANRETGAMEPRLTMHFRDYDKVLTLNKTNALVLVDLLESDDTDDWKGAAITLYVTTAQIGSERKKVIRVKDYLPDVKSVAVAQKAQKDRAQKERQTPADPFGDGPPDPDNAWDAEATTVDSADIPF